jgi:pimeloyl-ACP methyl ester carboxylesterase
VVAKSALNSTLSALDCMVMGSGPPLIYLPGLAPENRRPVGSIRSSELSGMAPYARHFTTYWVGRPIGLTPGTSFGEITAEVADALRETFDEPVSLVGVSTGGSFAQQLAAEHPDIVRRVVLISSGCRLAGEAAHTQRVMIDVVSRRGPRSAVAAYGWDILPAWRGRSLAAAAMWAFGLRLYPGARDTRDFLATLMAELDFDLATLPTITAPTRIINGGRDRFYPPELIEETARLVPGSRVSVHPKRGHIGVVSDRDAVREAIDFLRA